MPGNHSVLLGSSLTLQCRLMVPDASSVRWYHHYRYCTCTHEYMHTELSFILALWVFPRIVRFSEKGLSFHTLCWRKLALSYLAGVDLTFDTHFTKKLTKTPFWGVASSKLTTKEFSMAALRVILSGTFQDIRDLGNLFRLVQCYILGH